MTDQDLQHFLQVALLKNLKEKLLWQHLRRGDVDGFIYVTPVSGGFEASVEVKRDEWDPLNPDIHPLGDYLGVDLVNVLRWLTFKAWNTALMYVLNAAYDSRWLIHTETWTDESLIWCGQDNLEHTSGIFQRFLVTKNFWLHHSRHFQIGDVLCFDGSHAQYKGETFSADLLRTAANIRWITLAST